MKELFKQAALLVFRILLAALPIILLAASIHALF
jgi:hypothetical protein